MQLLKREIWSVLLPIYGLTISSRLFYQCVSEFFRSIGMGHFMGDPCLFRRLEGPGIRYPYPEHTDTEDWKRMAPNQRLKVITWDSSLRLLSITYRLLTFWNKGKDWQRE